jgi:hypothetical protein
MSAALALIVAGQKLATMIATDNPVFYERTAMRHATQYQSADKFIYLLFI